MNNSRNCLKQHYCFYTEWYEKYIAITIGQAGYPQHVTAFTAIEGAFYLSVVLSFNMYDVYVQIQYICIIVSREAL